MEVQSKVRHLVLICHDIDQMDENVSYTPTAYDHLRLDQVYAALPSIWQQPLAQLLFTIIQIECFEEYVLKISEIKNSHLNT